ncbi:SGNH/GDSL hydrolase family protein, partial [Streptomyces sp. NPDC057638]|uniref:SGNH/GDSL hydrolase family protein n=1 Tax=Streptomyces sp. NPDC057638 TaxID=3346190 RepID=UPI0036AFC7C3
MALVSRRLLPPLVAGVALTLAAHPLSRAADTGPAHRAAAGRAWTGTWGAAPSHAVPPLADTSIRNVVHTSVGGYAARITVTNRFGTRPLRLGAVTLALQAPGPQRPEAAAGTMRRVTFRGAGAVTVPVGRDLVSDPVDLRVPADAHLLVSLYTPGTQGAATQHRSARQTSFLAPGGDHTTAATGTAYTATTGSWHYLSGVDVLSPLARGSVVALGDSITDGSGSTAGANRRWPDRLAARLGHRHLGVLNAGIAGNRLLDDSAYGPRSCPGGLRGSARGVRCMGSPQARWGRGDASQGGGGPPGEARGRSSSYWVYSGDSDNAGGP